MARVAVNGAKGSGSPVRVGRLVPDVEIRSVTSGTVSDLIKSRFETFSRSQKEVARYIVDHLEDVAFQTAEALAGRAATSSSTVVRFSQALGFSGYPELQREVRDEYRRRPGGDGPGRSSLGRTEFEAAMSTDEANLLSTAKLASQDNVRRIVRLILDSDRRIVCGADQLAFFASYFRHLLALLGLRSEIIAGTSPDAATRLSRLGGKSLVIGFAAGSTNPLISRGMRIARHRGAATVAICDSTLSELVPLADETLYYSSESPSYTRSHVALLSAIQALAYSVYASDPSRDRRTKASGTASKPAG